jgi:hypothetical protein
VGETRAHPGCRQVCCGPAVDLVWSRRSKSQRLTNCQQTQVVIFILSQGPLCDDCPHASQHFGLHKEASHVSSIDTSLSHSDVHTHRDQKSKEKKHTEQKRFSLHVFADSSISWQIFSTNARTTHSDHTHTHTHTHTLTDTHVHAVAEVSLAHGLCLVSTSHSGQRCVSCVCLWCVFVCVCEDPGVRSEDACKHWRLRCTLINTLPDLVLSGPQ